jgi:hypothetical protein
MAAKSKQLPEDEGDTKTGPPPSPAATPKPASKFQRHVASWITP